MRGLPHYVSDPRHTSTYLILGITFDTLRTVSETGHCRSSRKFNVLYENNNGIHLYHFCTWMSFERHSNSFSFLYIYFYEQMEISQIEAQTFLQIMVLNSTMGYNHGNRVNWVTQWSHLSWHRLDSSASCILVSTVIFSTIAVLFFVRDFKPSLINWKSIYRLGKIGQSQSG
jgi:hypothetical protein